MIIVKSFWLFLTRQAKRGYRGVFIHEQAQPAMRAGTFKLYNLTNDLFTRKHRQFSKGRYPDL